MLRHAFMAALAVLLTYPSICRADTKTVPLTLTYNVTPHPSWQPGSKTVILSMDARRSAALGAEDIFFTRRFPGSYPREAGQQFDIALAGVKPNETIIVQGYMCSEATSDCYPSDSDNPPSCSVAVTILPHFMPSCQPVFTWTEGHLNGGVICRAECR